MGRSKPPALLGRSAGAGCAFGNPVLFALLARRYTVEAIEVTKREEGFQPAHAITPELRSKVAELHAEGKGVVEIGRMTGLNRKQVARILEGQGVKNPPSVPASSRLPEILELRGQGKKLEEIGQILGFSRKAVGRALAKAAQEASENPR
jgi:hypothetical protein